MNQQPVRLCAAGLFSFLCMGILMPALFKPSPWGPTPLIKGRCREATEGIGKVAGRKARRMRGHFKERASLEKFRRAGACPRRAVSRGFRRGISPPCERRASFWMPRKKPKRHQGVGSDGRFAPIFARPLDPHYGGRPPGSQCVVSGAQNLSGGPRVLPGHWALSLQKLHLTRFRSCA